MGVTPKSSIWVVLIGFSLKTIHKWGMPKPDGRGYN